ncbi:YerC/YecD family TrpR-related protein [Patescibacteria group bacterium]|nr:YerC/YecD family TrpR-related protein [Patescibacteria group bacterium]
MNNFQSYRPKNNKEKFLAKAFLKLKTEQEVANFLRDLLTIKEFEEFANRLEMARLLKKGWSYKKIARELKVSTTTVTRTAHWLFRGCGGYDKVLTSS